MNFFKGENMNKRVVFAAVVMSLFFSSGCGTLFFSERIGKKMSTKIDRRVFVTNCILCAAGIIPGVVAFILDYDNGSIYYTEAELIPDDFMDYKGSFNGMKQIPCDNFDHAAVARELSAALGKEILPLQIRMALSSGVFPSTATTQM
jgi:hypothetical protein